MQGFMIKRCIKTGFNPSTTVAPQNKRMESNVKDKLSQLPDEVLVTILSLLTMKEAGRTSVLSHRWCKLWTFLPSLNFDATETLHHLLKLNHPIAKELKQRTELKQKYINWVNSVLKSHQRTTIHELRLQFDLGASYSSHIDSWVNTAFAKKVESLTMHFARNLRSRRGKDHYPFPALRNIKHLLLDYTSLRKLDLMYVDISGDFIQYLISSCPHLEELAVNGSDCHHLVHLNIDGPSIRLKHLKIVSCSYVKSIYLSASNLSSFKYEGAMVDIHYANVPNLVDVSLGGEYFNYIVFNFPRLSDYVMRLETLTLRSSARQCSARCDACGVPRTALS